VLLAECGISERVRSKILVLHAVDMMWNYEDRLQSSWTHLITSSRNFVEVR